MKTHHHLAFLPLFFAALAAAPLAHAGPKVLIDFGSNSTFRGVSSPSPDSNGKYWNSVSPGAFTSNMVSTTGTATTIDLGFDASGAAVGTDSFNGPAGATTSPIDQTQIDATTINAAALGDLGIKEAAIDYVSAAIDIASGAGGRFQLQGLDPLKRYKLTFFGSAKFTTDATTFYSVYNDSGFSNQLATANLNIRNTTSAWLHNQDQVAVLTGLIPSATGVLYVEFGGTDGNAGRLNSMSVEDAPVDITGRAVLVDFGNASSFRGVGVTSPDVSGNYWNSVAPGSYWANMNDTTGTATTIGLGFSTAAGTDSYNGPAGATSNPVTTAQIAATNIDAASMGMLGIKEAAIDYVTGTDVVFAIGGLNPAKKFNLHFFGSRRYPANTTTVYSVYQDSGLATELGQASLIVGNGGNNNPGSVAVVSELTPSAGGVLYVKFTGSAGGTGTLNALAVEEGPDTTPPVITIIGANPATVAMGAAYNDAGATATDVYDGVVNVSSSGSVDTSVLGSYQIDYTATDAAGNSTTVSRTVNVEPAADTTPPVITIDGDNPATVNWGETYTDAGASATDDIDGVVNVSSTGTVNTWALGTYQITYSATDAAGNNATAVRTVNVVLPANAVVTGRAVLVDFGNASSFRGVGVTNPDTNGNHWNSVAPGAYWTNMNDTTGIATTIDLGFSTAVGTDSYNGPAGATSNPVTQIEVDATNIDAASMGMLGTKEAAIDFVTGTDVVFQIAGLNPAKKFNLHFFGSRKFPANATTVYTVYEDSALTTQLGQANLIVGNGGNNNPGSVAVVSELTPSAGGALYVKFTGSTGGVGSLNALAVEEGPDTTPPVITIIGDNPATVALGATYNDAGATATDVYDGVVNVSSSGSVDTSVLGSYQIDYTATDAAGNSTTVSRTVNVEPAAADTTPPVISVIGDSPATVTWGEAYTDAGASAEDDVDGPVNVSSSGTVDTSVLGSYQIDYSANDAAGNNATASRTVNVVLPANSTAPGNDGISPIEKYAYGATDPNAAVQVPITAQVGNDLVLTAVIRINDPNLSVVGKTSTDLINWSDLEANPGGVPAADQTNLPAGTERREFTLPGGDSKRFLRLSITNP